MPPRKRSKTSEKKSEGDTDNEQLIENYLNEQYKPFVINDLISNLHNKIKKTAMLKCLDSLIEKDKILVFAFGKTLVYAGKDESLNPDFEYITLKNITEKREKLMELERTNKQLFSQIADVEKQPTNDYINSKTDELNALIPETKEKMRIFKKVWDPDVQHENSIMVKHELILQKELNKRLKIMNNLINILKELSNNKNIQDVLDDIGIESV